MSSDCDYEYKVANEENQNFDEGDYEDLHENVYTELLEKVKKERLSNPKKNYIKNERYKKILLTLIKDEEVIWNSKHKLHQNSRALNAAWNRVVDNMPSITVDQCKTMWNDIRHSIRNRRKLAVKRKLSEIEYEDLTEDNEENIMSFSRFNSNSSKLPTKNLLEGEANNKNWIEPVKKQLNSEIKKYKIKNEKEKIQLVEVIKNEEIIWDTRDPLHFNSNALIEAWNRVAIGMYPMTVEKCKTMWKSLKDALRYRKKLVAKEKAVVSDDEDYTGEENVIEDILSLLSFDSSESKAEQKLSKAYTFEDNETSLSNLASHFSNIADQNEIPVIYLDSGDENCSVDIEDENDIFIKTVTRNLLYKKPKKIKTYVDYQPKRNKIRNEKEKRMFVEFMKKEQCIWNLQHEFHGEPSFVDEAWERIANQMSMTVDQCKTMWKSIKDALRYRRKKNSLDSEKNIDIEDDNLFEQIQLLFPPDSNKINRIQSVNDKDDDDISQTRTQSKLPNILEKEEPNEIFQSLGSISKAISELVTIAIERQTRQSTTPFKYEYVWRLIENLYLQKEETTINEINQQIINLVYDYCKIKEG